MTTPEAVRLDTQMITAVLRHFDWSPSSKAPGFMKSGHQMKRTLPRKNKFCSPSILIVAIIRIY